MIEPPARGSRENGEDPKSTDSPSRSPSEPVGQIHPQPWMTAPETCALIGALTANGAETRFIGGCVRDSVLKRPIRDIDVAVPVAPQETMALLSAAGIRVIPTGIDHGTVTAVIGKMTFEITSLRQDVETDGRRARVAFTDSWYADAARRDFTINAMSCSPEGDIYDYFDGLEDLGHGRIRFVGNPRERIREDVLRLLRFFRFYAHYGRPPPDHQALSACSEKAHDLRILSGERVRVEVFRTLMATDPADVFQLMATHGVLDHVIPEADDIGRLRVMTWLDSRALRRETIAPDPIRRFAALIDTDQEGIRSIVRRLKLSNQQKNRLMAIVNPPYPVTPDGDAHHVRVALRHLGADRVRDLCLLAWAGELASNPHLANTRTVDWVAILETADTWQPPVFPLRGRDAVALRVPRGRDIGRLLRDVETWWEDGDYQADREQCLERLKALATEFG